MGDALTRSTSVITKSATRPKKTIQYNICSHIFFIFKAIKRDHFNISKRSSGHLDPGRPPYFHALADNVLDGLVLQRLVRIGHQREAINRNVVLVLRDLVAADLGCKLSLHGRPVENQPCRLGPLRRIPLHDIKSIIVFFTGLDRDRIEKQVLGIEPVDPNLRPHLYHGNRSRGARQTQPSWLLEFKHIAHFCRYLEVVHREITAERIFGHVDGLAMDRRSRLGRLEEKDEIREDALALLLRDAPIGGHVFNVGHNSRRLAEFVFGATIGRETADGGGKVGRHGHQQVRELERVRLAERVSLSIVKDLDLGLLTLHVENVHFARITQRIMGPSDPRDAKFSMQEMFQKTRVVGH